MTAPMMHRQSVEINGCEVHLSPAMHKMALLFLIRGPVCVTWDDLSEYLWPDADYMPDRWLEILRVHVNRMRRLGIPLRSVFGRGYELPEANRVDTRSRPAMQVAA
jgi:hypothetical protein